MIGISALYNYPFYLEEEFFLSRADTGELSADAAACVLEHAHEDIGGWITGEKQQSQVTIVSPVFEHIDEAHPGMNALRSSLADIADSEHLRLIASGTHPLGNVREQGATDAEHPGAARRERPILGQRALVCGLHVQVAVPPNVDRIDLMNRLVQWSPLFLALSTSSPFWNGQSTGLLSYRQSLHGERPRSGVPDFFQDEADYISFTERMIRAGALRASDEICWAMRPTPDFPALELRIADACTCLEDTVALAALFRCLIATSVGQPKSGRDRSTHTRLIIDENLRRAKRDGIDARFIQETRTGLLSIEQLLDRTLTLVADEAEDLECGRTLAHLREIVRHGSSAHRQLAIYEQKCAQGLNKTLALRQVLAWLETTTLGVSAST